MCKKGKNSPCFIDRTGEKHQNNQGTWFCIIKYNNARDCTIEFENGYLKYKVKYEHIQSGKIRNPYHPSLYNIGYEGNGKYSFKTHRKASKKWYGVLKRCYDKEFHKCYPTYKDCTVAEDWNCFQNFAEWFYKNSKEEFELDKDLLIKGNKHYSSDTCLFVPKEINLIFTKRPKTSNYPVGVTKVGKKFKAVCKVENSTQKHLGYYDTPEEAFQVYKIAKEQEIKRIADKWKDKIDPRVY